MFLSRAHPALNGDRRFKIYSCRECSLQFADADLDEGTIQRIYGGDFHASAQQSAPAGSSAEGTGHRSAFPVVKNALKRAEKLHSLKGSGKLLDIGAARGYFVEAANRYFEAEGIDISQDAVEEARSRGLRMYQGEFLRQDFEPAAYDVITLWDVLACFQYPAAVLIKIEKMLRPGGILAMTVPDSSSIIARLLKQRWPLMIPPVNACYFSAHSIKRLLDAAHLDLERISRDWKWVSIDFALRKLLYSAAGIRKLPLSLRLPANWKLPINTFDVMTVIAKKPLS